MTKHEETSYLVDDMNPTGYAQIIEQIVREAGTATVTDAKVFTFGHDVIDQTTFTARFKNNDERKSNPAKDERVKFAAHN